METGVDGEWAGQAGAGFSVQIAIPFSRPGLDFSLRQRQRARRRERARTGAELRQRRARVRPRARASLPAPEAPRGWEMMEQAEAAATEC